MKLQRLSRFFLWMGLALLLVTPMLLFPALAPAIRQEGLDADTTTGGTMIGIGVFLAFVGFLFEVVGCVLKALSKYGSEAEEIEYVQ